MAGTACSCQGRLKQEKATQDDTTTGGIKKKKKNAHTDEENYDEDKKETTIKAPEVEGKKGGRKRGRGRGRERGSRPKICAFPSHVRSVHPLAASVPTQLEPRRGER